MTHTLLLALGASPYPKERARVMWTTAQAGMEAGSPQDQTRLCSQHVPGLWSLSPLRTRTGASTCTDWLRPSSTDGHVAIEMGKARPDPALCRLHSPAEAMAGVSPRSGIDEALGTREVIPWEGHVTRKHV